MNIILAPIFIIGCPRSGTSLLAAILNRHSNVCVTPELHYFGYINSNKEGINNKQDAIDLYNNLHNKRLINVTESELLNELKNSANQKLEKALFMAICNSYKKQRKKTICIEKTPDNVRYIQEILDFFPNALFIYIIRDGRDVALSLSKVKWDWPYHGFYSNLIYWSKTTRYLMDHPHINSNNTFTLKYEELLENPEKIIEKICTFLDILFEPKMLIPDGTENDLIEPGTNIKENIKKKVINDNKNKWKKELSQLQKNLSWKIASEELNAYNYEHHNINKDKNIRSIKSPLSIIEFGFLSNVETVDILAQLGHEITPISGESISEIKPDKSDSIWIVNNNGLTKISTIDNIATIIKTAYKIMYSKLNHINIIYINKNSKNNTEKWLSRRIIDNIIYNNSILLDAKIPHTKQSEFIFNLLKK